MLVEQWQLEVHNTYPVGHSLACLQIGKHQVGTKLFSIGLSDTKSMKHTV